MLLHTLKQGVILSWVEKHNPWNLNPNPNPPRTDYRYKNTKTLLAVELSF